MRAELVRRLRERHGVVEIVLVVVLAAAAAGVVLGSGFAQTVLATPNPLTWLRNLRGELTQVNPDAGTAVTRIEVAAAGDQLHVTQGEDGELVVTNLGTGQVTVFDTSMLRIGGVRPGSGAGVKVLLTRGQVYVVNKTLGLVERIDNLTAATVGQAWRSDGPLADAAADRAGRVWALGTGGRLTGLEWSANPGALIERERRDLPDTGGEAVLVSHEQGVTALDPSGTVTQVVPGRDRTLRAGGGLTPPLVPAEESPAGIVPVSTPEASSLHIVRESDVVSIDAAPLGCDEPGRAAVYAGKVYAPCLGDRKVVVLEPDGRRARADLPVAGDAELVLNAGLLLINVPSAETGLAVLPDGSVKQIRTHDPRTPVIDPSARPTPLPQPTTRRPNPGGTQTSRPTSSTRAGGPTGPTTGTTTTGTTTTRTSTTSTTTTTTTTRPSDPAQFTPTAVDAQPAPGGNIQVTWTPPPTLPDSYNIVRTDTDQVVARPARNASSFLVGGVPTGVTTRFVVEAVVGSRTYPSQPSNQVAPIGVPGQPNVGVELVARGPARLTLRVTVAPTTDGGSPITAFNYSVTSGSTVLGGGNSVPIGQSPQFDVACLGFDSLCLAGGSVTATANVINAAGASPDGSASTGIGAPPGFARDQTAMMVSAGGKCLDRDLRLHTCNGATSQLWTPRFVGDILSAVDRDCVAHNRGSRLSLTDAGDDECRNREDSNRWDPMTFNGNVGRFQGDDRSVCIAVIGDVAGEGVQVNLQTCSGALNQQFYMYKQAGPMAAALTAPAAVVDTFRRRPADAPVDVLLVALLILPIVVGLGRRSGRRRP